jgi:assimilatory nitrate reductase catalytic subunit
MGLFAQAELDATDRLSLLAGRPSKAQADAGEIVCACYQVGRNSLIQGIQRDGLTTPEAIGKALKAGTNCGSCVPELKQLIAQHG